MSLRRTQTRSQSGERSSPDPGDSRSVPRDRPSWPTAPGLTGGRHLIPANHRIPASPAHSVGRQDHRVAAPASLYRIRIKGRLGATALSAFPLMSCEVMLSETVLTGWLEDQAALFGVLAQIEGLGLQLLELRQIRASLRSPESADDRSPDPV